METQEWRTHARRHGPVRGTTNANSAVSPRIQTSSTRLSAPTIASANKAVGRAPESREAAPSRWKEMRQAVRIKATIGTDERRPVNARIADLCDEDREKVAKLVRRIVDVSALHEQSQQEFERQRTVLETELHELRSHAKRDAREIEELSDKLKDALAKVRDYQERVLVLEESNELEVRHRMETDQTVDLLKLEVDKLRKLVKRQKHEMEAKENEEQQKHRDEMETMANELKEAHEQLMRERRERLEEKQKELEERIQRTAAGESIATVNRYDGPAEAKERGPLPLESLLTTSDDLPDKIKEMMNEWKARMEEALATTAASIAQGALISEPHMVSTAMQTDSEEKTRSSTEGRSRRDRGMQDAPQRRTQRAEFDRLLVDDQVVQHQPPARRSVSPAARSSSSSSSHNNSRIETPLPLERSVTRALIDDFANASALVDDASFEDEVESTIALIDGLQSPSPAETPERRQMPRRKLSLYDSSMLDVVDAIENGDSDTRRSSSGYRSSQVFSPQQESPTQRIERLMHGLRLREQKLARAGSRPVSNMDEPSFLQDVELFNEVKDVYAEHLEHGRRHTQRPYDDESELDDDECELDDDECEDENHLSDPSHTAQCISVKEAIERDMQELMKREGFFQE